MKQKRVYFDNAATTPILPQVAEAMIDVIHNHFGNPSSIHTEGRRARSLIEQARKKIASAINSSIGEVFFTSGGTEANNTAIKCAVTDLGVRRIITSKIEHHCVLHSVEHIASLYPVDVIHVENDHTGRASLEHLRKLLELQPAPTLVTIMHANNEIGTLNDIEAIGQLCKELGAYFHTDTVQTVGHLPLDVQQLHVDFLSGAAHKFHGPKGVGFLYISNRQQIKPFIDGGAQERNMRGGTENLYGIVGMSVALEYAVQHMIEHMDQIRNLRAYLWKRLEEFFPGLRLNGCPDMFLPTVLNVAFPPGPKNEMLLMLLDIHGISASGGSACSSGSEKGSHVLHALPPYKGSKSIRFSFSHLNTIEEADHVVEVLKKCIEIPSESFV